MPRYNGIQLKFLRLSRLLTLSHRRHCVHFIPVTIDHSLARSPAPIPRSETRVDFRSMPSPKASSQAAHRSQMYPDPGERQICNLQSRLLIIGALNDSCRVSFYVGYPGALGDALLLFRFCFQLERPRLGFGLFFSSLFSLNYDHPSSTAAHDLGQTTYETRLIHSIRAR